MIYLIDDNQGDKRRKVLDVHFVDDGTFNDVLVVVDKLVPVADLSFLNEADCLLVHSTTEDWSPKGFFIEGANDNINRVINEIAQNGDKIPLVLFSNQMPEEAVYYPERFPNVIQRIKKNIFYKRLRSFLENYRETGAVNLQLIAYGKKYNNQLDHLIDNLFSLLSEQNQDDIFQTSFVGIEALKTFHSKANISLSFDEFVFLFEDKPITILKFLQNLAIINESNNEYGENIYDWPT